MPVLVREPAVFVAVILMLYVPAEAGVPVILPAFEHDSPLGSPVADHVIGAVPVALSVPEYGTPASASGRLDVVIDGVVISGITFTVNVF